MKQFSLVIGVLVLLSCSRDRVELLHHNIEYQSLDDFFEKYRPVEQTFTLTGDSSSSPLITSQGSKVWIDNDNLVTSTVQTPQYPIEVRFLELYSVSDLILSKINTGAESITPYTTEGVVKINCFKDGDTLDIRFGNTVQVDFVKNFSASIPLKEAYGGNDNSPTEWNLSANNVPFDGVSHFTFNAKNLGWINAAGLPDLQGGFSAIGLVPPGTDFTHVYSYYIIKDYNAVIPYSESLLFNNNLGVKIISFAKTAYSGYQWFEMDTNFSRSQTIRMQYESITEEELISNIRSL